MKLKDERVVKSPRRTVSEPRRSRDEDGVPGDIELGAPAPPWMVFQVVCPGTEDARALIDELDTEIAGLYPGSTINGIDVAEFNKAGGFFLIAWDGDRAVGCGGFRPVDEQCAEIKRMYVRSEARRRGVGRHILRRLEAEVRRRGFRTLVLETGCHNAEARALYESEGYSPIPAFLGYVGISISRCYAKRT